MTPTPNYPMLTSYDYFDSNDEYVGCYPMIHVPCVNPTVGRDVIKQIEANYGDQVLVSTHSTDDGGHISIAFDVTDSRYEQSAKTLVSEIRTARDAHSESTPDIYPDKAYMKNHISSTDELGNPSEAPRDPFDHPRYIY